jgi:acetylornithine deacetylase
VNPNNRPVSGPPFGEERMVRLLGEMLGGWGADVSTQEVLPGRSNIIARFQGKSRRPSLMLEAHSDTVQAGEMSIAPFEARVEGGRLYGRGACDDKGPMAAMLLGLRAVLDEEGRPPSDVYFVSTCNEELGGTGAARLMESGFRTDAAVVAEPTGLAIVHAHKGVVRWRIRTRGVAAHSSAPEMGVSAISMMARIVERINGPLSAGLSRHEHPLLGHATVSVGTIRGGEQVNVVASQCEIEVDRRMLPAERSEEATAELVRHLEEVKQCFAGGDYSCEETGCYPPLEEDRQGPVASLAAAACAKALGKAEFAVAPWGANTGHIKRAGIPCVLFGPGSIRQAHTADEFIELAEAARAVEVYAGIIRGTPSLRER